MALTAVNVANLALSRLGATAIVAFTDTTPEGVQCNLHYEPARDALLRSHTWRFASVWSDLIRDVATVSGTSTGTNTTLTLNDTGKTWIVNAYAGYYLWITGGTGADQVCVIASNTTTGITITSAFTTVPDATSTYEIWAVAPPYPWAYQYVLPTDFLRFAETHPPKELFEICGTRLKTDSDVMPINYVQKVTDPTLFDPLFVDALVVDLAAKLCMPLLRDKVWTEKLQDEAEQALSHAKRVDLQEVRREPTAQTWTDARRGWTPDGS